MNGIINVYKEKGYTSFDVVAKLRGILHQKKIGHTGTLDPDAVGVLPVCLGRATRVCDLLTDKDKEYETVLLLGQETDTQDVSGEVIHTAPVSCSEDEVRAAIASFVGCYEQLPPMYSALKVNGQKLCDLARKGITVERRTRPVEIYSIDVLEAELPRVRMRVHCSKGTYIRTLCKDIGDRIGCFGCMEELTRTRVAGFEIAQAITLAKLQEAFAEDPSLQGILCSTDSVFAHLDALHAKEEANRLIANGNSIPRSMVEESAAPRSTSHIRIYDHKNNFVGVFCYRGDTDAYKPVKLFFEE